MTKCNIKRRKSRTLNLSKRTKYRPLSTRFDNGGLVDKIGAVSGGITSILDSSMKNAEIADTSGIESNISDFGNTDFSGNDNYDSLLNQWDSLNWQKSNYAMKDVRGVSGGEMAMNTISAIGSGANAGASVGGAYGAVAGAVIGLGSSLAGIFAGNSKAKSKAFDLNLQADQANQRAAANFGNQAENIKQLNNSRLMGNIAAFGGDLGNTHGGDFSNGVILVDAGGTHEENPYEGVPMGIAPDGAPNLVEEGEVIYNDYVFSNRLHLTEKDINKAKLSKKYKGYTFALAAEDLSKESAERPNDPISKKGLEDSLGKLAMIQEEQRMKKGKKGTQRMMAEGGRKYSGIDITTPLEPLAAIYNTPGGPRAEKLAKDTLAEPSKSSTGSKGTKSFPTYLRYAPAVGSTIGALSSVFQKPDYSNSDLILNTANNLSRNRVKSRPINNYLTYKPLDRNYYLNQLKGQAGATRRAIMNSSNNVGNIMAGLLAADYNSQIAVGDALMKMDMYNEQQRQAVENFNRGTNQYNSQAGMMADAQSGELAAKRDEMRLKGISTAAGMREASDTALANSRSMNLTNFFDNLGYIGQDNMAQSWRDKLLDVGYFGIGADRVRKSGGMLTKRNRRRR